MKFSALLPQPDLLEKLEEIEGGCAGAAGSAW
jgi:hypothetical protein